MDIAHHSVSDCLASTIAAQNLATCISALHSEFAGTRTQSARIESSEAVCMSWKSSVQKTLFPELRLMRISGDQVLLAEGAALDSIASWRHALEVWRLPQLHTIGFRLTLLDVTLLASLAERIRNLDFPSLTLIQGSVMFVSPESGPQSKSPEELRAEAKTLLEEACEFAGIECAIYWREK